MSDHGIIRTPNTILKTNAKILEMRLAIQEALKRASLATHYDPPPNSSQISSLSSYLSSLPSSTQLANPSLVKFVSGCMRRIRSSGIITRIGEVHHDDTQQNDGGSKEIVHKASKVMRKYTYADADISKGNNNGTLWESDYLYHNTRNYVNDCCHVKEDLENDVSLTSNKPCSFEYDDTVERKCDREKNNSLSVNTATTEIETDTLLSLNAESLITNDASNHDKRTKADANYYSTLHSASTLVLEPLLLLFLISMFLLLRKRPIWLQTPFEDMKRKLRKHSDTVMHQQLQSNHESLNTEIIQPFSVNNEKKSINHEGDVLTKKVNKTSFQSSALMPIKKEGRIIEDDEVKSDNENEKGTLVMKEKSPKTLLLPSTTYYNRMDEKFCFIASRKKRFTSNDPFIIEQSSPLQNKKERKAMLTGSIDAETKSWQNGSVSLVSELKGNISDLEARVESLTNENIILNKVIERLEEENNQMEKILEDDCGWTGQERTMDIEEIDIEHALQYNSHDLVSASETLTIDDEDDDFFYLKQKDEEIAILRTEKHALETSVEELQNMLCETRSTLERTLYEKQVAVLEDQQLVPRSQERTNEMVSALEPSFKTGAMQYSLTEFERLDCVQNHAAHKTLEIMSSQQTKQEERKKTLSDELTGCQVISAEKHTIQKHCEIRVDESDSLSSEKVILCESFSPKSQQKSACRELLDVALELATKICVESQVEVERMSGDFLPTVVSKATDICQSHTNVDHSRQSEEIYLESELLKQSINLLIEKLIDIQVLKHHLLLIMESKALPETREKMIHNNRHSSLGDDCSIKIHSHYDNGAITGLNRDYCESSLAIGPLNSTLLLSVNDLPTEMELLTKEIPQPDPTLDTAVSSDDSKSDIEVMQQILKNKAANTRNFVNSGKSNIDLKNLDSSFECNGSKSKIAASTADTTTTTLKVYKPEDGNQTFSPVKEASVRFIRLWQNNRRNSFRRKQSI